VTTLAQQNYNKPAFLAGFILLLAIAAFFALTIFRGTPSSTVAAVKPIPQIQYQPHAVEKHGSDALAIRKCLNDKGGADEVWRSIGYIYAGHVLIVQHKLPRCILRLGSIYLCT
jgi:hypothetical protein